ncbi:hypothetical protein K388_04053 [Streptomyces sp. KhCrAH-43]|uniref:DUF6397 family protein n=1 Tax=Streptomyces sp. KhCrAH-43 TaxID=1305827 RepID=UPI00037CFAB7|nr:hypothetical protein [Streptomyces sp. SID4920]MYX67590.1 hypothetical protein [Streptomyces sp. SID8373]RAJ57993.1 hypothetical protein K388_04053 [Streptomyces sp. KhCrAH-43]
MTTTKSSVARGFPADTRPESLPGLDTVCDGPDSTVAAGRAATELELKRREFDLAVYLGAVRVRTGPDGRPRVDREEIVRLRSRGGFPDALRERVRTVGTAEGARLLGISPVRFTRLARAGCLTPVAFYLNRYRAVVWVYLAQEVEALAARSPELLVGNSPAWMRSRLEAGGDWRPRNWRSRRIERLLALADDPWVRAAIVAQGLDPVQLAEVVDDPYERAHFVRVRREALFGRRGSVAGREAMARLMPADEPDEILWRRISLITELDAAREARPAPRPGDERWAVPDDAPTRSGAPTGLAAPDRAGDGVAVAGGSAEPPTPPGQPGPGDLLLPREPADSDAPPASPVPPVSPVPPAPVCPAGPRRLLARLRSATGGGVGRRRARHGGALHAERRAGRRKVKSDGRAFAGWGGRPGRGGARRSG